ncbi:MAG: Mth938-like domain-containing protein [Thiotrichales bacterium]
MKFTEERSDGRFLITGYQSGILSINDRDYTTGVIVTPRQLIVDWAVRKPDEINAETLTPVLTMRPDVLIIGTGARLVFPSFATRALFLQQGIGCEIMDSGAACRTFNLLVSEGRDVVAAILPP